MAKPSRKKRKKTTGGATAAVPKAMPGAAGLESWITGHARVILFLWLALNCLVCLALFDPKPHTGGDNASYIILAESVLRAGDGYSDNITTRPARPHTQYPFGYPLLLAPWVALFGRNVVALKLFSVVLAVGSVAVFSLLARRIMPPVAWAGLTLAAALNPVIVDYSHWVLSEIAFLFFSMLSLYLLVHSEERRKAAGWKQNRWFWLGVLSLSFTAHIRTIGLGFAIAGFAYYALRRNWATLAVFTLAVSLLMAPWMVRNRIARQDIEDGGYAHQLLLKNPYNPELGTVGVAGLAGRVARNIRIYGAGELARVVLGSESAQRWSVSVKIVSIIFSILVLAGLVDRIVRGPGFLEIYFLVYIGVVLLWPEAWSDVRFVMPVVPLMLLYSAGGVEAAIRLAGSGGSIAGRPAAAAALVLALAGLGAQVKRMPGNLSMIGGYLEGDRYAGYPAAWRHLFEAADWVIENTPDSSVVTVRKPRLFYLHTGRKVDGYPFTTDRDSVYRSIRRTDYVVIDAVSGTTARYLVPAVREHMDRFQVVFALKDPVTAVLELKR